MVLARGTRRSWVWAVWAVGYIDLFSTLQGILVFTGVMQGI
jgi:hypothetical protein